MARKLSLPLLNLGPGSLLDTLSPERPTVDVVRKRLGGRASTEHGAGELVLLTTTGGGTLPGVVLFHRGDDVDVWVEPPAPAGEPRAPRPRAGEPAGPAGGENSSAAPTGQPTARSGIVRRARRADIAPLPGPVPPGMDAVAGDARVFGSLIEGQRIRYQDEEGLGEGTLIEKCRFGGLVQRDDGTLLGVGFRRIWPAHPDGATHN